MARLGRPTSDQNDPIIAQAIRMRENGRSYGQIIHRFGGSRGTWHWRFLVHGVDPGGIPCQRPTDAPCDGQIQAMRDQGMSCTIIARTIGQSHKYVISRLMRIARQKAWDEAHPNGT